MKKYQIEISVNNENNVIETKTTEAKNHWEALKIAEKIANKYFSKG